MSNSIPAKYGKKGGLLVLIDHPNKTMASLGLHLQHDEEVFLKRVLTATKWKWEDLSFHHVVPRYLDGYHAEELAQHATELEQVVERAQPSKILSFGSFAYAVLIEKIHQQTSRRIPSIRAARGRMHMYKDIPFMATVPPYMCFDYREGKHYWFRDFMRDLLKLQKQAAPMPEPEIELILCNDHRDLRAGLDRLRKAAVVSVDVETTGLDHTVDVLEAIGFGAAMKNHRGIAVVITSKLLDTRDPQILEESRKLVYDFLAQQDLAPVLAMHNGKFDMKFLNKWLRKDVYNPTIRDTMLLNYLLDERAVNDPTAPHGLKRISRDRYDANDYKFDFDAFWAIPKEERDWSTLYTYLGQDLYYTAKLYAELARELKAESPEAAYAYEKILCPASAVLTIVEQYGAPINPQTLLDLHERLESELESIVEKMRDLLKDTGFAGFAEFNPRSSKQVIEIVFKHFNAPIVGDKATTGADALDQILFFYKNQLPEGAVTFIELLLDFRRMGKIASTYAKPLAEQGASGILYGQFNLAGTGTGRLSSQEPNLQNIPNMAGDDIRRAFEAPPGYVWIKADYSQLELRTAAHLSGDKSMQGAFINGRDIHAEVAAAMFQINTNEVTKAQRFAAKFVDFGILYGRGAKSLAEGPELREYNWSVNTAQKFIDNYLKDFPQLASWMEKVRKQAVTRQYLMTPTGRRRRWPLILSHTAWKIERQAVNFPVQSLASDLTVMALIRIHEWLVESGLRARIVLTVHDEIDIICHHSCLHEVCQGVLDRMNYDPLGLDVPLKADVEIGRTWVDLQDWKPGVMPDFIKDWERI